MLEERLPSLWCRDHSLFIIGNCGRYHCTAVDLVINCAHMNGLGVMMWPGKSQMSWCLVLNVYVGPQTEKMLLVIY